MGLNWKLLKVKAPNLIRIVTIPPEYEGLKILEKFKEKYGSKSFEEEGRIKISLDEVECHVELIPQKDCNVFVLAITQKGSRQVLENLPQDLANHTKQIEQLFEILPNPISIFTIFVKSANNQNDAKNVLHQYSHFLNRTERSAGIVCGCLLATFEDLPQGPTYLTKNILISPFSPGLAEKSQVVWELCRDIVNIASRTGLLNQLYLSRQTFFTQIDASEQDTLEKIQNILLSIRKRPEETNLEQLELSLTEVTSMFSDLSVLSSIMMRDYIKAKNYAQQIKNLFDRWNETSFEGFPKNSLIEIQEYESLANRFKDFVDRIEAVRIQLDTLLDTVRTHIGIRQQMQSAKTLYAIEEHEKLLKRLTWIIALFTITLVVIEVVRSFHLLP